MKKSHIALETLKSHNDSTNQSVKFNTSSSSVVIKHKPIRETPRAEIQKKSTNQSKKSPWLPTINGKSEEAERIMLNHDCLAATYKCMARFCSFYTSDAEAFVKHLLLHKLAQDENYSKCSYCHTEKDSSELINHVKTYHKFEMFQCGNIDFDNGVNVL
jgi:hypothetical protein